MSCLVCGGKMAKATIDKYRYEESGLDYVVLMELPGHRCEECGEVEPAIPAVEKLHKKLAFVMIEQADPLDPPQIRFLRKYLGLSSKDFARRMGVTPSEVSRWENEGRPMGGQSDRALRLLVAISDPVQKYPVERLDVITKEREPRSQKQFAFKRQKWAATATL